MEVKKVAEEQEIWDEEEEVARLEEEAKKLVLEQFYKWIKVFGKKASERMLTKKIMQQSERRDHGSGKSIHMECNHEVSIAAQLQQL